MKTAGILTGGGELAGLNAVIRAVVRARPAWVACAGDPDGWRGMGHPRRRPTARAAGVGGVDPARRHGAGDQPDQPLQEGRRPTRPSRKNFRALGLDALVAFGGEDTLGVAARLSEEGFPGGAAVPKTIDNDLSGTDTTFGFDTAVAIADGVDRSPAHHGRVATTACWWWR